mmetsp:Transcript_139560/g.256744  ORF Transcript_139560/g.256744 Transcript_139560/m.256744 type:complete len:145 (-) Transcript_139560:424-858(-)
MMVVVVVFDVVVVTATSSDCCEVVRRWVCNCWQPGTVQLRETAGSGSEHAAGNGQLTVRCWSPPDPQLPMQLPHGLVCHSQELPWQLREVLGVGSSQPAVSRQATWRVCTPGPPHATEQELHADLHQLQPLLPTHGRDKAMLSG